MNRTSATPVVQPVSDPLVLVKETKLTDGSIVFDVVSIQSHGKVIISAESEKSAWIIADAINYHAVDVWGGPR